MLKDFILVVGVYVVGWFDCDSEGLLVLINDGVLQVKLIQLGKCIGKIYYVQVEGEFMFEVLIVLCDGVIFNDGFILFVGVEFVEEFVWLWLCNLLICECKLIFICWLKIMFYEGCNCQVCWMIVYVGFFILWLICYVMGGYIFDGLVNGDWCKVE